MDQDNILDYDKISYFRVIVNGRPVGIRDTDNDFVDEYVYCDEVFEVDHQQKLVRSKKLLGYICGSEYR